MDLFAFLAGASPWWWVAAAIAIGAVEMVTFSYFLIWFALAAFATAGALWLSPGLGGGAQLAWFAALSVVFTVAGRWWLARRRAAPAETPGLNRRSEQVIGRVGAALEDYRGGEGVIIVDGVRWRARLASGEAAKDAPLAVIDADGMTLIVEPTS